MSETIKDLAAQQERTHFVKVLPPGGKAWKFLASGGSVNGLRVHALQFSQERATACAQEIKDENAGWDAKIVPIEGGN